MITIVTVVDCGRSVARVTLLGTIYITMVQGSDGKRVVQRQEQHLHVYLSTLAIG